MAVPEPRAASPDVLAVLGDLGRAAPLYEGAIGALATIASPVCEWMAAYALRELLDELELAAGVGRRTAGLGVRADALARRWKPTRTSDGTIEVTQAMLEHVDEFLRERIEEPRQRRARAQLTAVGLEPAGTRPPPAILDDRVDALMVLRKDFNDILHGRPNPAHKELGAALDRFEQFMLAWLRPQPSKDFTELDRFLQEGPPDE